MVTSANSAKPAAADVLAPLFRGLLGDPLPLRFELWDGSSMGPVDSPALVRVRRPDALRRILFAPNELGIARAFVVDDLEIEGDLDAALNCLWTAHPTSFRLGPAAWVRAAAAAVRLGVIGRPPPPPLEEIRLGGSRHSKTRDAKAIAHHYDISNDFYRLVLGPSMTYSCARFTNPDDSLEEAQTSKHDLVCRKLGLAEGVRMLDVGCGWGSMCLHAAMQYGAEVVGITLSQAQADLARKRVAEAGVTGRVEIRIQDYRDLGGERFDAISSVGMFEHVGQAKRKEYFDALAAALKPHGRLLNHAISTPNGSTYNGRRSFVARYVFPDGELQDVGDTIRAAQRSGLETRDLESLREHYAMTLRRWVDNLVAHWEEAVDLVGPNRARVWRLYMTGSIHGFAVNDISVHQLLLLKPHASGTSGMPLTRVAML
jgi:cyclopropane-fatty-acyl-phospholipid synthase